MEQSGFDHNFVDENHEHLSKKEKIDPENIRPYVKTTLTDVSRKYVLSLKTLAALSVSNIYIGTENFKLLELLPDGLLNFIIVCHQTNNIQTLPINHLLLLLQIIHPNQNNTPSTVSFSSKMIQEIILYALDSIAPQVATLVINSNEANSHKETFSIPIFIALLIQAIGNENLIDMGFNEPQITQDYENTLTILEKEIDSNNIDLNELCKNLEGFIQTIDMLYLTPFVLVAKLMPEKSIVPRKFRTLSFLLTKGADINADNGAAIRSILALDLIKFCFDRSANPNLFSEDEPSALENALQAERWDIAQILLEQGADINSVYVIYDLCEYIATNNQQGVIFFLRNNANIYLKDMENETPLQMALGFELTPSEAGRLVIEKAMETKPQGNFNDIMRILVNRNGNNINILKQTIIKDIFVRTDSVNDKDDLGNTPLIAACSLNLTDLAKTFLENGADKDIDAQNAGGYTALMVATEQQAIELVKLLLDLNANIDEIKTNDYRSAYTIAQTTSNDELIQLFMNKRPNQFN
jgi:ankyrin repeat protein